MLESVLQRLVGIALAVLVMNALWAGILPSRSGQAVAALGVLIASVVIVTVWTSPRIRSIVAANPPGFLSRPIRAFAIVAPFLLPALVLRTAPVFAFWRFDGRSALLVAWLLSIVLAIAFEPDWQQSEQRPIAKALLGAFVFASAGLWLAIVMDSGIGAFLMEVQRRGSRPCQIDRLTTFATIWEANPASEHLFLGWLSQDDFQHQAIYANHVHPYLLAMYAWIRAVRRLSHLTLWQASNTTVLLPMLVLIAAFATLLARSGRLWHRLRTVHLVALFVAMGILLTTWRLWIDLVRFNSDNPYPLLAGILVLLYAFLLPPMRTRSAAVAAALFAALSPTNTPMVILPMLCLFGEGGQDAREVLRKNRRVLFIAFAAVVVGAVSYVEPWVLIRWKGYHPQASSFLFRSGLDGDTRYFSGLLQAAVAPCPTLCCYARSLSELLVPFVVPLAVLAPLVWWWSPSEGRAVGRVFLFLITPYAISLILFPQSASIHPYIYDHWLIIPVVVSGLVAMLSGALEERLRGSALLGFLLFAGAIVISNLLGLAQGLILARAITN